MASVHWQALLIAAASSTDNFVVGISVGLSKRKTVTLLVFGIAGANALGCLLATVSGEAASSILFHSKVQYGLAGLVFLWLSYQEIRQDSDSGTMADPHSSHSEVELLGKLAIPMTLNNLAGGVATGIAGVSPAVASFYAFWASVIFMYVGVWLGSRIVRTKRKSGSVETLASRWSCVLYGLLACQSFVQALY